MYSSEETDMESRRVGEQSAIGLNGWLLLPLIAIAVLMVGPAGYATNPDTSDVYSDKGSLEVSRYTDVWVDLERWMIRV
jgi:hypothetical protein